MSLLSASHASLLGGRFSPLCPSPSASVVLTIAGDYTGLMGLLGPLERRAVLLDQESVKLF